MVDFVDIPDLPGLPGLFRPAGYDTTAPVALVADALDALSSFGQSVWGIYQGGAPLVIAETVADLGYSKTYAISDFPVEQGAFQSFDKVEQPFEARIRFVSGSSLAAREALISSIETIIGDLQFYDIVTPERVYSNANVVREEYRRINGGMLTIEVAVQEIRLPSTSLGFNPSDPASADPVNLGTVRATPATPSEMAAAGLTPVTTPAGSGGIGSA